MNRYVLCLLAALLAAACDQTRKVEIPSPAPFDPGASSHFCGMAIGEHPGPKGQIWVEDNKQPVWFASVRDTIAFTLLPEEPKDIRAIYVTDMATAPSWEKAAEGQWIEARTAIYVIDSTVSGGMDASEAVPFSQRAAAEAFVVRHGGRLVAFTDIPRADILGTPAGSEGRQARTP
jgi:copper chaperone NosL